MPFTDRLVSRSTNRAIWDQRKISRAENIKITFARALTLTPNICTTKKKSSQPEMMKISVPQPAIVFLEGSVGARFQRGTWNIHGQLYAMAFFSALYMSGDYWLDGVWWLIKKKLLSYNSWSYISRTQWFGRRGNQSSQLPCSAGESSARGSFSIKMSWILRDSDSITLSKNSCCSLWAHDNLSLFSNLCFKLVFFYIAPFCHFGNEWDLAHWYGMARAFSPSVKLPSSLFPSSFSILVLLLLDFYSISSLSLFPISLLSFQV